MNDLTNISVCERSDQLIAFLYGETDEHESQEFQSHLRNCNVCRVELASFGELRESITEWKDETVGRFALPQLAPVIVSKKSAVAALREFFDLSPLWLKGAVGFATLAFVVLLGLVIFRPAQQPATVTADSNGKYTTEQVNQIVKKALEDQATTLAQKEEEEKPKNEIISSAPESPVYKRASTRSARPRARLSRAEREQLAADLRLLTTEEEANLNLLGDRINEEF